MNKLDKYKKSSKNKSEDNIWSSISDLMSGLMIVFLFISISFMAKVNKETNNAIQTSATVKEIVNTYNNRNKAIYDDLVVAFQDYANKWNMNIDQTDGTIRFEEPDVLFGEGESKITPKFQEILNQFFPLYIETIYKNHKDSIKEIRIEGHTSSSWRAEVDELTSFFKNMELSQTRTRNVLNYVMNIPESKPYEEWLRKNMTANGLSSSRLILDENGNEDAQRSRRVEFRIVTDSEDVIRQILEKGFKGED